MVKITFLGTSAAIPSAKKNHTSILLSYDKENILVDCGEGTQRQFRKAKLNPMKLTRILITHWHGDHVLGIPGLFQTLAFSDYKNTLFIYGPRGTKKFIQEMLKTFHFSGKLDLKVEEVEDRKFLETSDFYLEAKSMTHGCPCNAYCFVKKSKIRIDKKKLEKTKLPSGPLLGKLKEGKDIIYEGKKYLAKNLIYIEDEKKISFIFDTSLNSKIIPFVKESDLLISEASFDEDMDELAKEYKHLTAKDVGDIAKKAKVEKLILTHISQRYSKDFNVVLNTTKKIFKNVSLANDLDVVEI